MWTVAHSWNLVTPVPEDPKRIRDIDSHRHCHTNRPMDGWMDGQTDKNTF